MRPSNIYRVAALILLVFAFAHTFSFSLVDPKWGIDNMLGQMRSIRFGIGGIERTYWDFYLAGGLQVGLFLLFSSVLAWQLSRLPAETLRQMRLATWAFAATYAAILAVSLIHLFLIPIAFSAAVTIFLAAAAWAAEREFG